MSVAYNRMVMSYEPQSYLQSHSNTFSIYIHVKHIVCWHIVTEQLYQAALGIGMSCTCSRHVLWQTRYGPCCLYLSLFGACTDCAN